MLLDYRDTQIVGPQDRILFVLGSVLDAELKAAGMNRTMADEVSNRIAVRFQSRLALLELVQRP